MISRLAIPSVILLSGASLLAQDISLKLKPTKAGQATKYTISIKSTTESEGGFGGGRGGGGGGRGGPQGPRTTTNKIVFTEATAEDGALNRRYMTAEAVSPGFDGEDRLVESALIGKDLVIRQDDAGLVVSDGKEALSERDTRGIPERTDLSGLLPKADGEIAKGSEVTFDVAGVRKALATLNHPIRGEANADAPRGGGRRRGGDADSGGDDNAGGGRGQGRGQGRGGQAGGGRFGGGFAGFGGGALTASPVSTLLGNEKMEGKMIGTVASIEERNGSQIVTIDIKGEFTGEGFEVSPMGSRMRGGRPGGRGGAAGGGAGGGGRGGAAGGGGGGRGGFNPEDVDAEAALMCTGTMVFNATAGRIESFKLTGKSQQAMQMSFGDRDVDMTSKGELVIELACEPQPSK